MKSSDLWSKLPTPSELLANPRVRSVVDRLNPNVVTARVRSFLDEVRGELAQRSDRFPLPTMAELADRVSRYLTGADAYRVSAVVNATGSFRGPPWLSAPLANAAVERMLLVAQDFAAAEGDAPAPDCDAARRLCDSTGAGGAAVFASHAGAVQTVLRALAPHGDLLIARGEVTTIDPDSRLTDLAAAAGARLREVGAADRVTLDDYVGALSGQGCSVLRLASSRTRLDESQRPALAELVEAAARHNARVTVELDCAPLDDAIDFGAPYGASARAALDAGARLVVVRGDGLIGGPACGVVLGDAEAVDEAVRSPLACAARIDAIRAGALAATVELLREPQRARLAIPTVALLTTPLENLRSRAERLAPQIAASPMVASADAVELPADAVRPGLPLNAPSWGVRVVPSGDLGELVRRLRSTSPSVWVQSGEGAAVVNLRTVQARQDLAISAAFHPEPQRQHDHQDPPERADA